jgi:hypothetical protein
MIPAKAGLARARIATELTISRDQSLNKLGKITSEEMMIESLKKWTDMSGLISPV